MVDPGRRFLARIDDVLLAFLSFLRSCAGGIFGVLRAKRLENLHTGCVTCLLAVFGLSLLCVKTHVVGLREVDVEDIGAIFLEFSYWSLREASGAHDLAHCVVGLVLGAILQVDRRLRILEAETEDVTTVLAASRWCRLEPRAHTNASVIVNGPLEFQEGAVERLEVFQARHEAVV